MIPWIVKQRLRSLFRSSMWMIPIACTALALVSAPAVRLIDAETQWPLLNFDVEGGRALLAAFIAASISYIVFLASALLIAVQLMSAQLSPRVIREFMLNRAYRIVLGIFVFTFIYSVAALARTTSGTSQQLTLFVAIVLNVASIGAFLYLVDYILRNFRPSAIMNRISAQGTKVIEYYYPLRSESAEKEEPLNHSTPVSTIMHSGRSGVILSFDEKSLVEHASRTGSILSIVPQVGDFVATGEVLMKVFATDEGIDETVINKSIAVGPERTMEQDPSFAFRILVDIAIKALSPAINDPTTAVNAIDQLHRLLLKIGFRVLDAGAVTDSNGQPRLRITKPHWQDFVSLAISEIRIYGSGSLQVCRRLEAMVRNMIDLLPAYRAPALIKELEVLRCAIERQFPDPEDRLRALTPDALGLGGGR